MKEKHALIVAVETYQDRRITPVKYAENDASALASVIRQHGYLETNATLLFSSSATKARIESTLRTRFRSLEEDDNLLVFYAGHGFSSNGKNFITCHDTVLSDLPATSIPFQVLFTALRESRCQRIVLMLDCCHSGLPINESMRGLLSEMTDDEFEDFCGESQYHIAFSSCNIDELSFSSSNLKHGIWTYHLIEAFEGANKRVLDRDRFLTASSLQSYLSLEVPRTLRRTLTGTETQTPRFWGNLSREAILADFAEIFARREAESKASLSELKRASFWGSIRGSVRSLSGFKKYHTVPDDVNDTTRSFVQRIGSEHLSERATDTFGRLKSTFSYKRREIDMDEDEGSVSIQTPDLTVNMYLDIDDDPSQYVLATEVTEIRNLPAIETEAFARVFDNCFDRIVFEFTAAIPIEEIIDKIEDLDDPDSISVKYTPDATECTVKIEGFPAELHFAPRSLTLKAERRSKVDKLLSVSKQLPNLLYEREISTLLPSPEE